MYPLNQQNVLWVPGRYLAPHFHSQQVAKIYFPAGTLCQPKIQIGAAFLKSLIFFTYQRVPILDASNAFIYCKHKGIHCYCYNPSYIFWTSSCFSFAPYRHPVIHDVCKTNFRYEIGLPILSRTQKSTLTAFLLSKEFDPISTR